MPISWIEDGENFLLIFSIIFYFCSLKTRKKTKKRSKKGCICTDCSVVRIYGEMNKVKAYTLIEKCLF